MSVENLKTRIISKHDIEANWNKATNFIPYKGEIIIYDADSTNTKVRIKIGDGTTKVTQLPFYKEDVNSQCKVITHSGSSWFVEDGEYFPDLDTTVLAEIAEACGYNAAVGGMDTANIYGSVKLFCDDHPSYQGAVYDVLQCTAFEGTISILFSGKYIVNYKCIDASHTVIKLGSNPVTTTTIEVPFGYIYIEDEDIAVPDLTSTYSEITQAFKDYDSVKLHWDAPNGGAENFIVLSGDEDDYGIYGTGITLLTSNQDGVGYLISYSVENGVHATRLGGGGNTSVFEVNDSDRYSSGFYVVEIPLITNTMLSDIEDAAKAGKGLFLKYYASYGGYYYLFPITFGGGIPHIGRSGVGMNIIGNFNDLGDNESIKLSIDYMPNPGGTNASYQVTQLTDTYTTVNRSITFDTVNSDVSVGQGINSVATVNEIRGNSADVNQMVINTTFETTSNWFEANSTLSVNNHKLKVTSKDSTTYFGCILKINVPQNHKILIRSKIIPYLTNDVNQVQFLGHITGHSNYLYSTGQTGAWDIGPYNNIYTATYGLEELKFLITPKSGSSFGSNDYFEIENFEIIDLTQWFGAGKEPTTVEEAYQMGIPMEYLPYNKGELINFGNVGIKTVGFNAYNNATKTAKLIGRASYNPYEEINYQITGNYTSLSFEGTTITPNASGIFHVDTNGILTVVGGDETTCVHLVWSGYRNGQYEDYWESTWRIPVEQYSPDGLKSVGATYDSLLSTSFIKRVGSIELTTSNIGIRNYTNISYATVLISGANIRSGAANQDYMVPGYPYKVVGSWDTTDNIGFALRADATLIYIGFPYGTTLAEMQAALVGKFINYRLATEVTTTISPALDFKYYVSDFGTEEVVSLDGKATTAFKGTVTYLLGVEREVANLNKNFISAGSMGGFLSKLSEATGTKWYGSYNPSSNRIEFNYNRPMYTGLPISRTDYDALTEYEDGVMYLIYD